jgi:hypothetical protein
MRHAAIGLACVLLHLSFVAAAAEPQAKHAYRYYLTGNAADVQRPSKGLLVLQGGGDDEYNEYIYKLCHCDSVETLVVASRAQLAARMSNADAAT